MDTAGYARDTKWHDRKIFIEAQFTNNTYIS